MTALEARAWIILRALRPEGIHVRRQHPVGRYVADFAVMRARLAIEIDGPLHEMRQEADRERDRYFANAGWRVLRVRPQQLDDELRFYTTVRAALAPSPRGEGVGGGVNLDVDKRDLFLAAAFSAPSADHPSPPSADHPSPLPPPLAGRGTPSSSAAPEGEAFAPHLRRRTRANRRFKPRCAP